MKQKTTVELIMNQYSIARIYLVFLMFTYTIFCANYFAVRYWKYSLLPEVDSANSFVREIARYMGTCIVVNNLFAWIAIPVILFKFYRKNSQSFTIIISIVSTLLIVVWFYIAKEDLAP
jgi:hypothetical protein